MEELRECPFCGAKAELISNDETTYGFPTPKWAVRCEIETCIAHDISPNYSQHEDAIKDWNTRADSWISVKDRTPKNGDYVFCVSGAGIVQIALYDTSVYAYGFYANSVTHWQPLPTPPKGSE